MASRRAGPGGARPIEARDRWRRSTLIAQGLYYLAVGLWPLLHFSSYARAVALPLQPFQVQTFAAVLIVVGGSLIEAARREPPGPFPTLLGAAVAGAIALVSLFWLPRLGGMSWLWLDLLVEVAFAVTLLLLFPRPLPERRRAATRRGWTP